MPNAQRLIINTDKNRQVVDITDGVQGRVDKGAAICTVFVAHTTCAVTTADLDPGTDLDLLDAVWEMIPKLNYATDGGGGGGVYGAGSSSSTSS